MQAINISMHRPHVHTVTTLKLLNTNNILTKSLHRTTKKHTVYQPTNILDSELDTNICNIHSFIIHCDIVILAVRGRLSTLQNVVFKPCIL